MSTSTSESRRSRTPPRQPSDEADGASRLTQAMENYLLSIYLVQERGLQVTNVNVVQALKRVPETENLGTSPPSVSGMLRRMEREDLISLADSRSINLTAAGHRLAKSIIRRHRLAARMVVDLLGVERRYVNVQAHMLEHAMSRRLEEKIRDCLGNPTTDPFGQPIPGSDYREPAGIVTLDEAPTGCPMAVDRIPEEDEELVDYLEKSGMLPGTEVVVDEINPYRGVVTLHACEKEIVLGYGVSSRIRLRPVR